MTYLDPFPKGTRISQEFRSSPGGYNPPGGHTGRDYAVQVGTPIRAAHDGIIRHSSWFTDNYRANAWWLTRYGGDTLVLDCTDAFGRSDTMPTFVYAHCSNSIAAVGQRVKKGQIIGLSGNSGTATSGPHCHVERINPGYDLTNSVYGRSPLNFDEFYEGGGIAAQGTITTPKADDEMTPDQWKFVQAILTSLSDNVATKTDVYALKVWDQQTDNETGDRIINTLRADIGAMNPATLVDLIPDTIAGKVADLLAKRLAK